MYDEKLEQKKKRKKKIIFTILILLFIILFFFLYGKKTKDFIIKQKKIFFPTGEQIREVKTKEEKIEEEEKKLQEEEKIPERKPAPRLRQVSFFPTGGFLPLNKTHKETIKDIIVNAQGEKQEITRQIDVKEDFVLYSDIKEGNIFESKLDPYEIKETLLAENIIPNAERAFFSPDGIHVVFQYWNQVKRYAESYLSQLRKKQIEVEPCSYSFREVKLGEEGDDIHDLHVFLNQDPRTRVSLEGIDSPGNEGNVVTQKTLTAIKNFQSVYGLEIDGKIGGETKKKMEEVCNERQKKKAEEKLAKEKTKYEITSSPLPDRIEDVIMSPDGKEMFYLMRTNTNGISGIKKTFASGKSEEIFHSPFHEWLSQWNEKQNIQLTTKASALVLSYTYGLNPTTGEYRKTIKERKGLTTLASPDNTKIFIHYVENGEDKNALYYKDIGEEIPLINIKTFPEKCTWTKNSAKLYCFVPNNLQKEGEYPDRWYQGLELFSDQLWEIDGKSADENLISDIPEEYQKNLDAIKVNIDEDEHYLYFIDKGTETLWSYRLYDVS